MRMFFFLSLQNNWKWLLPPPLSWDTVCPDLRACMRERERESVSCWNTPYDISLFPEVFHVVQHRASVPSPSHSSSAETANEGVEQTQGAGFPHTASSVIIFPSSHERNETSLQRIHDLLHCSWLLALRKALFLFDRCTRSLIAISRVFD